MKSPGPWALPCLAVACFLPVFGALSALAGLVLMAATLLVTAAQSGKFPSPQSGQAALFAVALGGPLLVTLLVPLPGVWALVWLLSSCFFLAAPAALWLYHRSLRNKP